MEGKPLIRINSKQNSTTVAYENNDKRMESVYSKRIRAGKRRTYFFDVRTTRGNDYYLTITESRKRFNDDGYDRHKIFLYKEDFNKFIKALTEAVDYVKTDLMPDFDFDAFNHENDSEGEYESNGTVESRESREVSEVSDGSDVSQVGEEVITVQAETPLPVELPVETPPSADSTEEVDKW